MDRDSLLSEWWDLLAAAFSIEHEGKKIPPEMEVRMREVHSALKEIEDGEVDSL